MARPRASPSKYLPDLLNALKTGSYLVTALEHAGLDADVYHRWMRLGARAKHAHNSQGKPIPKEDQMYVEFHDVITKAVADGELHNLATIKKASMEQWQAAAWLLERRHPDRYGRRTAHRFEEKAGEELTLDALRDQIRAARAGQALEAGDPVDSEDEDDE